MSNHAKRVHHYHAGAIALGGSLEHPFKRNVAAQAPMNLSAVGGYASARAEKFEFEGIASFHSALTQVAGTHDEKTGGWSTLSSARVEGLNILNVVTADRVVTQITTEHPAVGYVPRVNFHGTQFHNLRVNGRPVEIDLDLDICSHEKELEYPAEPCTRRKGFLEKVDERFHHMKKSKEIPEWLKERYKWDNARAQHEATGSILCSLVKGFRGDVPAGCYGHAIDLPGFGRIFIAELLVDHNSYRLSMLRLELGCPVHGMLSIADTNNNGSTHP